MRPNDHNERPDRDDPTTREHREPGNRVTPHLDDDADPSEIKADIGRTRAAMDRTLDEIGERLSPGRWLQEAVSALRGTGRAAGEAASDVGEAGVERAREIGQEAVRIVRRHPVPTALLVGGLAWLVIEQATGRSVSTRSRRRAEREFDRFEAERYGSDRYEDDRYERLRTGLPPVTGPRPRGSVTGRPTYYPPQGEHRSPTPQGEHRDLGDKMREGAHDLSERASHMAEDARERASDATRRAKDRFSSAAEGMEHRAKDVGSRARHSAEAMGSQVSRGMHEARDRARNATRGLRHGAADAADRLSDAASDVADRVSHVASDAAHRVSEGARIARQRGEETVDSHPLAVAAAMFGVGLLMGVAVPSSRREDRWFGEESDELKETAKHMGEDVVHRGKEVVSATAAAAREEARRQGLTPEGLKHKGEEVASHTAETVKQEAKKQGLTPESLKHKGEEVASKAAETAEAEAKKQGLHPSPEGAEKPADASGAEQNRSGGSSGNGA